MVEVNGTTLIDRAIHFSYLNSQNSTADNCCRLQKGKELKEYIGNRYDDILKIEYVKILFTTKPTISTLWHLPKMLVRTTQILLESDLIFDDSIA